MIMQDNEKKPALRFKGFTDPWEQRKLKELYFQLTERNTDLLPYQKTLSVATMSFKTDGNGAADTSLANYKRLRTGDIAFEGHTSKEFRYGRFVLNDVGDGIMSPRFSALRPLHEMPINFWKYYIHYEPIMRKVLVNSTKAGTMMNELVINDFLQGSILVPSMAEQQAIGRFFKQLDTLITLHQRKYEKLVNIKKSMLNKMFPPNGASVPEIRFKGFTDPWEQRKLGDVADIVGGGTPSTNNPNYWDGDIDWYAPAEIAGQIYFDSSQRKITEQGYENSSAKMLPPGTVLFTSRAGIGKTAILSKKGCTNQGFQSIVPHNDELDSYFVFSRTDELKQYGELVGAGSTFVEVSGKQMAAMNLKMPTTIEEQQTIGRFFKRLDTLITLHQRKLEKLQNIKKSCLEKMFV